MNALRQTWLCGTIALTFGAFAAAILLAPGGSAAPGPALESLIFLGSSVHVASTAWFYTVPEIRGYAGSHRARYVYVPAGLILGGAALAAALSPGDVRWATLAFFVWQFWHFQKQNLGMSALSRLADGAGRLGAGERRAVACCGAFGIAALLAQPKLLQLSVDPRLSRVLPVAAAGYAVSVAAGVLLWLRRERGTRRVRSTLVYFGSLAFFAPVFAFGSPYAAVAGLTIAHGLQYVLIMALLAGSATAPRSRWLDTAAQSAALRLLVLVNIGVLLGAALSGASHLHDAQPPGRALYGAFLGATMAHFVIDAGLWRLRDSFPREFLRGRLPYLLAAAR